MDHRGIGCKEPRQRNVQGTVTRIRLRMMRLIQSIECAYYTILEVA